jgi:hypothetical protein
LKINIWGFRYIKLSYIYQGEYEWYYYDGCGIYVTNTFFPQTCLPINHRFFSYTQIILGTLTLFEKSLQNIAKPCHIIYEKLLCKCAKLLSRGTFQEKYDFPKFDVKYESFNTYAQIIKI